MADARFISDEARTVVEKAICDAAQSADGVEVVEIRYTKEYGSPTLTVLIWSQKGVDLDACESVHNLVSAALDRYEELFPENYVLNVSSQGLDRAIVTDDDFRRALGTEIEVVEQSGKEHGTLKAYEDETITILSGKTPKEKIISRNTTVKVQPFIRF